jgi:hypothetical protein
MRLCVISFPNLLEGCMSVELILGAITAFATLVYLLAVLARPERY